MTTDERPQMVTNPIPVKPTRPTPAALARRPRPPLGAPSGTHRCPRCRLLRPLKDFRPDHATFDPDQISSRCKTCRRGLNSMLRDEARRSGLCEFRHCYKPQHKEFRCIDHPLWRSKRSRTQPSTKQRNTK
jgi:hypothetical protein